MRINKPNKSTGINHKSYDISHLRSKDGVDPQGTIASGKEKRWATKYKNEGVSTRRGY